MVSNYQRIKDFWSKNFCSYYFNLVNSDTCIEPQTEQEYPTNIFRKIDYTMS